MVTVFRSVLSGVGELDGCAVESHPDITVGSACVGTPDALVVVLCLLVCQFRVLDAVLDCLDMSVRECEVASVVLVLHEAVEDAAPAWLDASGVVSVGSGDVVGVTPEEEC